MRVRRAGFGLIDRKVGIVVALLVISVATPLGADFCWAQEELIAKTRTPPPALDDLETDANKDGLPDGWYNAKIVRMVNEGGAVGPHFVRFECDKPGRLATLSRTFGVDGAKTSAIELGIWVRLKDIQFGEREASEPGLVIDLLGASYRQLSRGSMGPWRGPGRNNWTRVVKRFPVPPDTKDVIMTVGLLGATGTLDVDGLTVRLIDVAPEASNNLVVNGDFELGDPCALLLEYRKGRPPGFPRL